MHANQIVSLLWAVAGDRSRVALAARRSRGNAMPEARCFGARHAEQGTRGAVTSGDPHGSTRLQVYCVPAQLDQPHNRRPVDKAGHAVTNAVGPARQA